MTAEEAAQVLIVGYAPEGIEIVAEIPKSLHTPRPKKDKQPMVLICVSMQNPLHTRLTMEEKWKVINIEIDEEEEYLEGIIIKEDKDEGMEEETEPAHPPTKLPTYIPPWKGKAKVPKDLDKIKNSLQIPLLPNDVIFECTHLGQVPSLKFEDWDLADHEKFPHLEIVQLMKPKQNTTAGVTELEPRKWLCGVEKAGLLNLL